MKGKVGTARCPRRVQRRTTGGGEPGRTLLGVRSARWTRAGTSQLYVPTTLNI
ncbi:MAG: hypothetical protein ABI651_21845 [Verrucomicrobiota bacterium]